MITEFIMLLALSAMGLAGLLFWTLRGAGHRKSNDQDMAALESAPQHLSNAAQIRQALDAADLQYAAESGGQALAARLRSERRKVTLLYLAAMRRDFEQSLEIARIIAMLSPELSGSHEYERLRLSMVFRWRFQVVRIRLLIGSVTQSQIIALGEIATSLAVQMEAAMAQLGERAALAAELAPQSEP
jgi:hypothetical protein